MRFLKTTVATFALGASMMALPSSASTFSPPGPLPFERVNLRMTVDSCAFDPSTVFVGNNGSAIQVRLRDRQCLVAGTPTEVDVRLGAFPVGLYMVEVVNLSGDILSVRERLQFSVVPRAVVSIHQNPSDSLFVASFEYSAGIPGQPTWHTFQSGRWSSATVWQGTAYRTTFPLAVESLGPVTIEFEVPAPQDAPAGLKWARVTYLVGGDAMATQYITCQSF